MKREPIVKPTTERPKKLAVLYVRVSSTEQEKEGYSIQSQQKLVQEYAKLNEFVVVEEKHQ